MSYADRLNVPFTVFVGEDEIRDGLLSVKDMRSGEQQKLPPAEAAAFIARCVAERNAGSAIRE